MDADPNKLLGNYLVVIIIAQSSSIFLLPDARLTLVLHVPISLFFTYWLFIYLCIYFYLFPERFFFINSQWDLFKKT